MKKSIICCAANTTASSRSSRSKLSCWKNSDANAKAECSRSDCFRAIILSGGCQSRSFYSAFADLIFAPLYLDYYVGGEDDWGFIGRYAFKRTKRRRGFCYDALEHRTRGAGPVASGTGSARETLPHVLGAKAPSDPTASPPAAGIRTSRLDHSRCILYEALRGLSSADPSHSR